MKKINQIKNEEKGVRLLVSMLVRYPMVDMLDIDLGDNQINFSFFLKEELSQAEIEEKIVICKKSFNLFNNISIDSKKEELAISNRNYNNLTRIDLSYKVSYLTQKKLDFIIRLIMSVFEKEIYLDKFNFVNNNQETLDNLLTKIRGDKLRKDEFTYLAFREEGKIMVFNKAN